MNPITVEDTEFMLREPLIIRSNLFDGYPPSRETEVYGTQFRLMAARPLPAEDRAKFHLEFPQMLEALLETTNNAAVEFTMRSDEHCFIETQITVVADNRKVSSEIAGAIRTLSGSAFETSKLTNTVLISAAPEKSRPLLWPVVPKVAVATTGYRFPGTTPPQLRSFQWLKPADFRNDVNVASIVYSDAGTELSVCVMRRGVETAEKRTRHTQIAISVQPPKGLSPTPLTRASLSMQLSGLRIAETSCSPEAITWYAVRTSELERLIPLATASEGTITPGVRVGASPVIPFQPGPKSSDAAPRQHREEVDSSGTIASDLRIGAAPTTIYGSDGPLHDVRIEPVERLRHLHILGQTGTGKSSLIADLAHQISDSDEGMIILDPHGSLVERVAKELSPVARQRTWLIRCGDTDAPVPLNPLATDDPIEREKAIASVCDMFQYLFGSKEYMVVGPRFKERVAMGIRMLYGIHGSLASLVDVPEILSDSQKIKELARETTDSRVKVWARSESAACRSSDHGELVQWVNSKFEEFNGSAHVRGILGSGLDSFDAAQAMDEGRIILIDLSTATLGEQAARLLGYMYLSKIWLGALQRTNTRTFSVIVDEAHLLTAGSLVSMLSEGRKFGLSVILAHQYLDQLSDDLAAAVAGNVGTVIAMRQALKDAHTTAARVGELTVANYLTRQADLTALVNRTAAVPQSKPHTLFVDYNDRAIGFDNDLEALVTSTCRDLGIAVK